MWLMYPMSFGVWESDNLVRVCSQISGLTSDGSEGGVGDNWFEVGLPLGKLWCPLQQHPQKWP
jgi:hypothetical protein